jgi:hypothetical protein
MSETTTIGRQNSAVLSRAGWGYAAAAFSAGAGLVHASAAGQHADTALLATMFGAAAAAQIGWALFAFARPSRLALQLGLELQIVCIAFWGFTRLSTVSAIEGLDHVQPVGTQDLLTVALEALTIVAILVALRSTSTSASTPKRSAVALAIAGAVAVAIAVPASAIQHGHGDESAAGHAHGAVDTSHAHAGAAVAPVPYDPAKPIDLGGVEGVTPQQQATAENIIAVTLVGLPQWSDPAVAEAAGFHSIGDGRSGIEHFVNEGFMTDDVTLDPDRPESLVYDTTGGGRRLVAAMYMEKRGLPLEDVPDHGGALMQWHIHDNLCYNSEGHVAGLTDANGNCRAGLTKPEETPMIHVWIEAHPCGPFAALEGIGGGRIPEGEEVLCDHAHGA